MRLPRSTLGRVGALGGTALVLGYLPMAHWEARMRATGGPGILGLQCASDAASAQALLATWGPDGRRAALEQTWADFVWMHSYAVTATALVELARRRTPPGSGWDRAGRLARVLPYAALACDVVEGVGQLATLRQWQEPEEATVTYTRAAATAKYALLALSAGYAVGAVTLGSRPSADPVTHVQIPAG